jgi:hypothetical protein
LSVRGARADETAGIDTVSFGAAWEPALAAGAGAPACEGAPAGVDGPAAGGAPAGIGATGGKNGVVVVPGGAAGGVPGAAAVGAPGGSAADGFGGPDGVCGVAGFDAAGVVPGGGLSDPRLHAVVAESDAMSIAAATAA